MRVTPAMDDERHAQGVHPVRTEPDHKNGLAPASRMSRAVPLVIASALFMEFLDSTIVATALPAMALDLGVAAPTLSVSITVYLVSLSVLIPASGWVADKFGARRVLVCALLVFLIGSIACGASSSLAGLIAGRALQGMAGALMMPVGRLIILRSVPKHELMSAWAWLTMPALIGPMLGPPLGGLIVTHASWRWIFWVNIPIGIAGAIAAMLLLPNVKEERVPPFDARGFILCAISVSSGVFALETAGQTVLPAWICLSLAAISASTLVLYLRHARRIPEPIIDISLFSLATFRVSAVGGSIFRIAVGATPFLLPLQLQLGFGQSALQSGLTTFVGAMGAMAVKPVAVPLVNRFGFRRLLTVNAVAATVLMGLFAVITRDTPQVLIMALLFCAGYLRSLEFTSLAAISYADVERERMSQATTLSSMMQQISMSLGVAIAAGLVHLLPAMRGANEIGAPDFSIAMAVVAILAGSSALVFAKLPKDAGASVLSKPPGKT